MSDVVRKIIALTVVILGAVLLLGRPAFLYRFRRCEGPNESGNRRGARARGIQRSASEGRIQFRTRRLGLCSS